MYMPKICISTPNLNPFPNQSQNPRFKSIMGTLISPQEWANFVDRGTITSNRALLISKKIKENQPLTKQEQAIYASNPQLIENLLKG